MKALPDRIDRAFILERSKAAKVSAKPKIILLELVFTALSLQPNFAEELLYRQPGFN